MNERQKALRLKALKMIRSWGKGSSGRVLSSVDLMEGLFFGEENGRAIFNYNPDLPQWEERDLFVLSKLEALPALYSCLEMAHYHLPEVLPPLPDRHVPGVEVTSFEHGYALGAAVGMAQQIAVERQNRHVFCLVGDYELSQGKTWEAIMNAAELKLDRLCMILDENATHDLHVAEKLEAFGWRVIKLRDAHDHDEVVYGYMKARVTQRKPTCIWAPTVKSAGVPFAERKPEYDDVLFSDKEMEEIEKNLI